jgi:ribonuclease BN (tRNA processing enzyme)
VGFGVLGNLIRMGDGALEAVNELYITHTHSDHIGDFTGMIWAMALQGRTKQLRVICSETTEASLKRILELQSTPRSGFVKFAINYLRPEEAGVKHLVTIHNPENYAYRFKVENGPEFVYTGDTAKFLDIAKFTLGSDLIIHDATFVAGQESLASLTSHSTAHDAGSIGEAARVDKLVLTHIAPGNEGADRRYISEAGADFDGQIIVAKDNLIVDI